MLRVRDIMTRDVVSLAPNTPLEAAMWRLAANRVSGAPVRDRSGNVIGVLSKSDLVDPVRAMDSAHTVADAMTPGVWAVHPDEPALEAVRLMVQKEIHRVVVIAAPGHIEGIVTPMNVMRALLDGGSFYNDVRANLPRPTEGQSGDGDDGDNGDMQEARK